MPMNTIEKSMKVERALRQLRQELAAAKQPNQCDAINHYLIHANDDSKARLYDILTAPEPDYVSELTCSSHRIVETPDSGLGFASFPPTKAD